MQYIEYTQKNSIYFKYENINLTLEDFILINSIKDYAKKHYLYF